MQGQHDGREQSHGRCGSACRDRPQLDMWS
jgi:hypothetical protein